MDRPSRRLDLIWPLLICVAGWLFIAMRLHAPLEWDSMFTYLPAARAFLEQGWGFLLTPASCRVAPLSYLWPALWGADPVWIRIANMALLAGCVWFLWRASCLAGGRRAGIVAMLLLPCSDLIRYFPSEMTEPVYLFGVFGLMHALARLVIGRERTFGAVAQGAVMLTITLLARPVMQLIAPAALLAGAAALAFWAIRNKGRPASAHGGWPASVSRITLSLGLGLLLPLAVMVMNGLAAGFWGLRTGAGVGLYLGTHPLFQGTEPAFLGSTFEVHMLLDAVTGNQDVLAPTAEPVTRAAALWQVQNLSVADAAAFFGRKLWWWLAHHPAEIQRTGSPIRQLRLFALSTIMVTALLAWRGWRGLRGRAASYATVLVNGPSSGQWAFAAVLLGMFLLFVGQLLPVFYNSRYGCTMLDPWLIALTAFCVALITQPIQPRQNLRPESCTGAGAAALRGGMTLPALASLAAIAVITCAAHALARKVEHIAVDPRHMGQVATHLSITDGARIDATGMARQGDALKWAITQPPAALMVRLDQSDVDRLGKIDLINAFWDTEIALHSTGQQQKPCRNAEVAYQTASGAILQPAYKLPLILPLSVDGKFHHLVTHANAELRPREAGGLRIVLNCPAGTLVQWRQTSFLESRHAWDAAAHVKR